MKLVVGAGYLGKRVARLWCEQGDDVAAVSRSAGNIKKPLDARILPVAADVTVPMSLADLPTAEVVVFAVGYDRHSGLTHRQVYVAGLENFLHALESSSLANAVRRFIYVSTTGVYAASETDDVDEESPCEPATPGAVAHLEAETVLKASSFADRAIVLRMAGLYGNERVPRSEDLRAGRPIAAARDGWVNFIHVDDAAATVLAAETWGIAPRIYNVADGQPANRREYLEEVARLMGAAPPEFVEPDGSALPSRGSASKRISNRRMMTELKVALRYPSFREGLVAAFQSDS